MCRRTRLLYTAPLLAAIGLFGLLNYSVTRRTREIGILRALGWKRWRVVLLIQTEATVLALAGVEGPDYKLALQPTHANALLQDAIESLGESNCRTRSIRSCSSLSSKSISNSRCCGAACRKK